MEDTKECFACEHCDGEFAVETDCSMKIEYCCFCGELLDVLEWDEDYENFNSESEGT